MPQETPATDKKETKAKKPFYKRPRFWVISFLVVLSLPLLAVAGVYFALKSSLVESYIWPKVQPIIAEQTGFQVELSQIRIDLLKSISLKGIQVSQVSNPSAHSCDGFSLSLEEVELNFSALELLSNHLQVNKLALNDLQATGCLLLDLDEEKVTQLEEANEELDLAALTAEITNLLENPPISITLDELALNNFKIDLQVKERQQQLSAAWQGEFDFSAQAVWQGNGIKGRLASQLVSLAPLTTQINQQPTQLDFTSQPSLDLDLAFQLSKHNDAWQFKLSPAQINFDLLATQLNLAQAEENIQLSLANYRFNLASQINLSDIEQEALEEALDLELQLSQQLTDLDLQLNKDHYQFQQLHLLLTSQKQAQAALAQLELNLAEFASDFSFAPIQFQQRLTLEIPFDLSHLTLYAASQLNEINLLEVSLTANNQPRLLSLEPQVALNLPQQLASLLTEPSLKDLPGDLQLEITGNTRINHDSDHLLSADLAELTGFVEQSLNLKLSQKAPTTDLKILQPLEMQLQASSSFPESHPDLRLQLSSQAIQHPPLLKPLPFNLEVASQVDADLKALKTQLDLAVNHQPLVKLDLAAADQPQLFKLNGFLDLSLSPSLASYLADLKPLAEFGQLLVNQQFQLAVNHPEADLLTLAATEVDLTSLKANLKHGLAVEQTPAKNAPVNLKKPFKLQQTLNWQAKAFELNGNYQFAALELPEMLAAEDLNLSLELKATSGLAPDSVNWLFSTQAKQLTWLEETPPLELSQLLPLKSQGSLSFNSASETLTLHQFSLELKEWFKQELTGEVQLANLDKPSLQIQGKTQLSPTSQLIPNLDLTTSGSLTAPWQLLLNEGEQLSLQAQLAFNNFSLALNDLKLESLEGAIEINEELKLSPDAKLSFFYLLKPEAFERVDFNQIEPYLAGNQGFSFKKLQVGDLAVGPLQARFKVRQNLIELPQFSLQLLAGNLAGRFYLDTTPKAWRLGLLSRISQLDLRLLLPKRATSDYAPISARTALEFDFNRRLLAGRIDITDITRSQLLQLLELVDPNYLDPQINNVRSALRLAHPQWISVVMQNGLMDLTFGLSLFSDPLRAHGLPLSPIIERFGEEALLLPNQLPLE
ncbi:hypothetical protein [Marinospirillum insulare]|uniref:Dicarboxylate transport domain-containing protein n=1 Tax=Marinospirillum insulare TaxID=217169 RepID=A0ABQ6A4Q9_9GAMM|nr:hypothetical protein [Marinospirillum insulare]GLR65178.1 hypothetical protein GCM10007878_26170 [Marinospirillum insulare]